MCKKLRSSRPICVEKDIFQCPPDEFKERIFSSVSAVTKALKEFGARAKFRLSCNSTYASYRCNVPSCRSRISFKIQTNEENKQRVLYSLTFRNDHIHSKRHKLKGRYEDMANCLNKIGLTFLAKDAYTILNHKFGLTKRQFYHYRKKLTTQPDVIKYFANLKEKGYIVAYD